jgi:DNA-binding NarL/FixJ family response regulator
MGSRDDWTVIRARLTAGPLTDEQRKILDLLADGESTPSIARALGQSRSMVWRKAQRLRTLASDRSLTNSA